MKSERTSDRTPLEKLTEGISRPDSLATGVTAFSSTFACT